MDQEPPAAIAAESGRKFHFRLGTTLVYLGLFCLFLAIFHFLYAAPSRLETWPVARSLLCIGGAAGAIVLLMKFWLVKAGRYRLSLYFWLLFLATQLLTAGSILVYFNSVYRGYYFDSSAPYLGAMLITCLNLGLASHAVAIHVIHSRPPGEESGSALLLKMVLSGILCLVIVVSYISLNLRHGCHSNAPSAIATLRTINTAQQQYKTGEPGARYGSLATLSAIGNPAYLDTVVGSGTKSGYTFVITVGPRGQSYSLRAGPAEVYVTGDRYFYTDRDAVIRHSLEPEVDAASNPID